MSASPASFLLPDAEPSWRLWKSLSSGKTESIETPSAYREASKTVVVGLPATACRTVGLVFPGVDTALLPSMIEAQLEKRGIIVEKVGAVNYAWHLLGQQLGAMIVSVDVLTSPFPSALTMPQAANYTSALRMMSLPANELVAFEEQGLIVLALGYQGKLWHSHVVGTAEMTGGDLAREIGIAKLSLEATEVLGGIRTIRLVGSRLAEMKAELSHFSPLPFETATALEPNRAIKLDSFQRLLPQSVLDAQSAKERRRRAVSILMLMLAIYAVLAALAWWHLRGLHEQEANLQAEVSRTEEPAGAVRQSMQRWRQLEPAVDIMRYPMVQLSQVSSAMPPSGVVIRKFSAKPNEIELNGDARDAQSATQLLEDLKSHPKLSRFNWSMPVPSVRDKTASFKILGKLEGS